MPISLFLLHDEKQGSFQWYIGTRTKSVEFLVCAAYNDIEWPPKPLMNTFAPRNKFCILVGPRWKA